MLIHVNGVNLSKILAAVLSNIFVKYCKGMIKFIYLFQFVYWSIFFGNNSVNHNNLCISSCTFCMSSSNSSSIIVTVILVIVLKLLFYVIYRSVFVIAVT